MSISTIQNFYKETITRAVTLVGATNIYVSALPTPSEGYVVISPSSSSLREIVYYTAKGTDSNGTYLTVTLANRGLGGTTAQTHAIGEPVRMNVTAEHIKEISDAIDQIVEAGAQDASTIAKGVTKLSVAPVSATNPIAVGDNDPRLGGYGIGDGSDGDVTISSGTTTLTRDTYYNNLTVEGTGTLQTAGFRFFVKNKLKVDGTSGASIKNEGGAGGNGSGSTPGVAGTATSAGTLPSSKAGRAGGAGGGINGAGSSGVAGFNETYALNNQNGGAGGNASGKTGGVGGTVSSPIVNFPRNYPACYYLIEFPTETSLQKMHISAGGGSGAGADGNSSYGGGGGGGSGGGGGIIFFSCKELEIIGTGAISVKGGAGGNGGKTTGVYGDVGGGGGAGGNGGVIFAVYARKSGSGTMVATGGVKGVGGGGGGLDGENGHDGLVIEITN